MIFGCPVVNGIYHKLTVHRSFGRCIISAEGMRHPASVIVKSVVILRNGKIEKAVFILVCMIIYNVHNHTYTLTVKSLYHLFKLINPYISVIRVCRIASFGSVVVLRVISPVIFACACLCFINRAKVIHRIYLNVRYSQTLYILYSCRNIRILGKYSFKLGKCKILSTVCLAYSAVGVFRKISYVNLPYNSFRLMLGQNSFILIPANGIGSFQFHNHTPVTIYTYCFCVKVCNLAYLIAVLYGIGIINVL